MRSRKSLVRRPYISTTELLEMTGVTRKTLRVYEEKGIVAPAYVENDYFKYWTLEQADDLSRIALLARGERSLDEIAVLFNKKESETEQAVYRQLLDDERLARRALKSSAHYRRRIADYERIGIQENPYLRSIPMRWFALVELDKDPWAAPQDDEFLDKFAKIKQVIEIVGWAKTNSYGYLLDIDEKSNIRGRFLYIELATAPMPAPIGHHVLDCGCFIGFLEGGLDYCDASHCFECALFGRMPTAQERKAWKEAEAARGQDEIGVSNELRLQRAAVGGPWSLFAKKRLGISDEAAKFNFGGPLLRPQLMPQDAQLPYGVTACAIPNAAFLCLQSEQDERQARLERFEKFLSDFPQKRFTRDEEERLQQEALENLEKEHAEFISPGPSIPPAGFVLEPAARVNVPHGNEQKGWARKLEPDDPSRISVLTDTALLHDSGSLIIVEHTPLGKNSGRIRHEIQVMTKEL